MAATGGKKLSDWLPTTKKEMALRGWEEVDVILFSGDAYVDHPSFGVAVVGRTLEHEGLRVAIVPQPDWHGDFRDFKKLQMNIVSSQWWAEIGWHNFHPC